MRLIDADYLDELIAQLNSEGRGITRGEYKMIDNILFEFPTVDVPERNVGEWIWDDEGYHCSECFFHAYGNTLECLDGTYRYCPNCGARMKGADDAAD